MNDLGRIAEAGCKLVDAFRNISRRGIQALGLVLAIGLALGCVRFGGLDAEKAFVGGLGTIVVILLLEALSNRR